MVTTILFIIQFFFSIIIGLYFLNLFKTQQGNKIAIEKESKKELEKLKRMRDIKLTEPLAEKTRPAALKDIIGQSQGIKALRAALCGPNPQHVIIYGPPGVGKTAAARVILEEAKKNKISPFRRDAKFVEIDATTVRFDERGIADPLIGSVHDPIYQGAGAYGVAGIPQPKPGAVTKAHGGILFIDEIGELHPIQMNKLLKVLEDRKVFLESAYYSSEDKNIPSHIHEIFQRGLPADFRLVGATTRTADEIPPAIRSRCVEIYFRPLTQSEIMEIARNAAKKGDFELEEGGDALIAKYAQNGREAVNIVQIAGGVCLVEGRNTIRKKDIEWVIEFGHYSPRVEKKVPEEEQIGGINGLAVFGNSVGMVVDIEVSVMKALNGKGEVKITGIIEEEEMNGKGQKLRRTSSAKASVENVLTVLKRILHIDLREYDIHLNFPGGIPIDGPSAGIAIATAIYSAIKEIPISSQIAMTGEISIRGKVKPVGGVVAKVEAAKNAGIKKVLISKENWQEMFEDYDIEVIPVEDIFEVFDLVFKGEDKKEENIQLPRDSVNVLSASPAK
ncbi:MAG TPA: ATP-dependent protease LonB [Ruminiclostridium sp.]|jgi:Lon-like ATP-dependent protease|uniref:endopeptidase La n=1 Tax=Acetivibrio saccincola TaxID=1677857 RepID=A0A2K9E9Y2_9FIRM|nr:ATP-dependent protease LonB [Acetivibrio saccincola]AUG58486.1 Lon protease 2 [Acetivibrio saccincola]NLW27231.1 ATP-dependent protease LonB [Acetivibrio saccincola]HAA42672.1 ATP-dependent protease LonB [Ruminiclostridium sp.]